VEQEPEEKIADILSVDLVTVAEVNFLAIETERSWALVYPGFEGLLEKRAHVEVMVPFKVDEFGPARHELPKLFQDREILGKGDPAISYPELEQIAEDEEGVGITL